MKVLVLGGAGGMGAVAARESAAFDRVESVTIADLAIDRARSLAEALGPKAAAIALDVNDLDAMAMAISAHDLVLNTVGPFYVLGVAVLEQVIEARRNYIDICDDWEPTLDMLALSTRARENGVTALIGLGASPGVTNMLALLAAGDLDEVDEVLTGWSIDGDDDTSAKPTKSQHPKVTGASAAAVHWMQQLTGTIRVLRDGGFQNVRPLERREIVYPGYGEMSVWTVGHPEAVTLPRHIHGLVSCANVMVGESRSFDGLRALAKLVDAGLLTVHQAADEIAKDEAKPEKRAGRASVPPPGLFGWARGRHAGRPATAAAHIRALPPGGMAGATGVPLALGLTLFADGLIGDRKGVFAPEEIIKPETFLDLLAPRCAGAFQNASELVVRGRTYLDA